VSYKDDCTEANERREPCAPCQERGIIARAVIGHEGVLCCAACYRARVTQGAITRDTDLIARAFGAGALDRHEAHVLRSRAERKRR
jgi:hypothetical protein